MRTRRALSYLVPLVLLPLPLAAQDLVDATDPAAVLNIASGWGSALLETDSVGDPMIRGRIEGISYVVYFYGCTDGADCASIQMRAGWLMDGVPVSAMNEWNRDRRFGKAYLDGDGDPVIEMNVNLAHGVSARNLDDTFAWYAGVIKEFTQFLEEAQVTAEETPAAAPPAKGMPEILRGVTEALTGGGAASRPESAAE